jgi:hypothetical protein
MEQNHQKNTVITGGFLKKKQDMNRKITMQAVWNKFCETGRIDAFRLDWKEGMANKPHFFWDSDVAKWMEAAAYLLADNPDAELTEKVEMLIDEIEAGQWEDGYFNIYFTVCEPGMRFRNRSMHELYCAGHLLEAAVAYYEATGRDRFLRCMEKYMDYIYRVFVEEKSASFVTPGHEEIELALLRFYACTGKEKALKLAEFFLEERGRHPEEFEKKDFADIYLPSNNQSHLPVREQKTAQGHAVRACYLYIAMAMLAVVKKDEELAQTCRALYQDILEHKMYITGGIGSTYIGEAFTVPYDLPDETAYCESCASIGMALFSAKMTDLEPKAVYGDIIEKEWYNGILAGISLDGKAFFYENPLEINLRNHIKNVSSLKKERYPRTSRLEILECSCCPPNLNRYLASLQNAIYSKREDTYYIHQFAESCFTCGDAFIEQQTQYPLNGALQITCRNVPVLKVRIPQWCKQYSVNCVYEEKDRFICITNPDKVYIEFSMVPRLIQSHVQVYGNAGKVALQYGPVVYCMEAVDNGENLHGLYLNPDAKIEVSYDETFGLPILLVQGLRKKETADLYTEWSREAEKNAYEKVNLKFIPYSCYANRGETDMMVWVNVKS